MKAFPVSWKLRSMNSIDRSGKLGDGSYIIILTIRVNKYNKLTRQHNSEIFA